MIHHDINNQLNECIFGLEGPPHQSRVESGTRLLGYSPIIYVHCSHRVSQKYITGSEIQFLIHNSSTLLS